jgi:ribonuclease Z
MSHKRTIVSLLFVTVAAIGIGIVIGANFNQGAEAAGATEEVSPVKARALDFYVPNTEDLAPDEMRVVACGTGMPTQRMAQAAACFLVELGNGDKFIFDIGSGAAERLSALQIPYDYLDKIFIGHLHGDHFGSIGEMFVRHVPLRIWGPSGPTPELGTKYAIDKMREMYTWDVAGRLGMTDTRGFALEVNEFDYRGMNEVIYQENGVTIRSWPAVHAIDGPVSFSLEWKDLKFVFSSDTYPNKWFIEYAQDADIAIHECFIAVPSLVTKMGFTPEAALMVGTQIHTAPEAFGKVMSTVKPRRAVAYHFFKDYDTTAQVYERIRSTYDGPLSLAEDFMVWNVTKDGVRERMALVEEATWAPPLASPAIAPDMADRITESEKLGWEIGYSDLIAGGKLDYRDVIEPIYREASEAVGREMKYPEQ